MDFVIQISWWWKNRTSQQQPDIEFGVVEGIKAIDWISHDVLSYDLGELTHNFELYRPIGLSKRRFSRDLLNWTFVTEETTWISNDYSCDLVFSRFNKITLWRNLLKTWFLIQIIISVWYFCGNGGLISKFTAKFTLKQGFHTFYIFSMATRSDNLKQENGSRSMEPISSFYPLLKHPSELNHDI